MKDEMNAKCALVRPSLSLFSLGLRYEATLGRISTNQRGVSCR
jgi:hypothetical protein